MGVYLYNKKFYNPQIAQITDRKHYMFRSLSVVIFKKYQYQNIYTLLYSFNICRW